MPDLIDPTEDPTERGDLKPTLRDGHDGEAKLRAALEKDRQRGQQLRRNARASYRAMEGSLRVRSEEDWMRVFEESREEYESGGFLLDRLGAERFLDPKLIATLLSLRQSLIAEWGRTTAADTMLVDLALLHYYNAIRVQGCIGDWALHIERQFFGQDAFAAEGQERARAEKRRSVDDHVRRLGEQLMPLLDRTNRMFIRNLKAIKELRQGQVPAIAIGRADQVTVTNRPPGRLRPVKTELPQALWAQGMRIAEETSDTSEARPDAPTDAITADPAARSGVDEVAAAVGGSPKRRARQRARSVARSPQTRRQRRVNRPRK